MNILFVTDLYPRSSADQVTNVSFALHYFVKEWVKQPDVKIQVLVLTAVGLRKMFYRAPELSEVTIDDVKLAVLNVRCKVLFKKWFFSTRFIRNYLKTIRFVPDVIVSHMPIGNEVNLKLNKFYDVPFICGIHMSDICAMHSGGRSLEKVKNIVWRSSGIQKNGLNYLSPEREFIALSGVESDLISDRKKIFDAKHGVRFITVGRLLSLKNIDVVLECLAALPEEYQWTYSVIGSGKMESSLRSKAENLGLTNKVSFTGELSREECITEMDKHDVFVMVSSPETFGLVYLEALARGLVVIGAKGCGIDGVIHNGVNGFLCEPRSTKDLGDVFLGLYENDMTEIVKAGCETVKKLTDTQRAEKYLDFIREIESIGVSGVL